MTSIIRQGEKKRANLQQIASHLPGVIYQLLLRPDGSHEYLYISSSCQQIYERKPDEIQRNSTLMWGWIDDREQQDCIQSLLASAQNLTPWQRQWQYQTPSGKTKYLSAIAHPRPQPNGDIIWDGLILENIPPPPHQECCHSLPKTQDLEPLQLSTTGQFLNEPEPINQKIEYHKAETVLEETEEFLWNIYNGVEQVIFVVAVINEAEFRCLGWNPKTEKITGIKSAEVYGKSFGEILGLLEGEKVLNHYQDCVQAKASIQYEEEIYFQGRQTFSLTTLNPILDSQGKVYRIIGTSVDITPRKKAELALQESQIRFKRLAENVPGVTYQYHQYNHQGQGHFTYLSPKCLELTEIQPEVIIKNADFLWKLIHPDDVNSFVDSMAEAVDTGKPWQHQYRLITPSGKLKWIQAGGSLGKQADGSIVWDGLLLDISDRKQAEEAWQNSEKQLRELAEREKIQNCIANLIRNSLDWNKILETTVQEIRQLLKIDRCYFVGYRAELNPPEWEILKESKADNLASISELYPGNALHPISDIVLQGNIIQIDQVISYHIPAIRNFLMVLELESVLIFPLKIQSGDMGALVLAHCQEPRPWKPQEVELLQSVINQLEIAINQAKLYTESQQSAKIATAKTQELEQTLSQLQQAQIQLVQSEKMSSLGQMVGGIAHEINNPVSFIFGNLTYAQEYLDDLFSVIELYQNYYPHPPSEIQEKLEDVELDFIAEDLPRLLNSMKTGAERIRDIVKSLRIFSRLDEAELKDIDLHETLDSTLMLLESRLKEQPHRPAIQVIKQYGILPRIECYAGELNQVLMNLLTNAIDAIEQRNKKHSFEDIIADPGIIWITTLLTDSHQVQIRIADNGIGMTTDILAKIFDPFFTTKDVGLGTGLGLSTSYKIIVEKHGGHLSCISEVGLGTEIIIEIPKQQPIGH
ncbi:Nodulation protein V [Planktothrix tepida]|uniref:histidine kinase n=1 Tax=Planktothrix tepida PCC 9214 TaxID=671072 RepID=A0A1J1LR76_9CYAN|nr:PAS domain-containing protein [Planktothrix tepida]CAD5966222.1 Nodulation protein V [Planktothrix tepida]CUR35061.1 putative Histidine kinase [Planktothrix tepida PCC 9214]